ncbi:MAG: hypothetical protein Q9210_006559 [Variospora velana]
MEGKHLRTDQRRNDVQHAFREITQLCNPSLRTHPNIVRLVSWGMSLDALEAVNVDSLSAPLLILERAHCDLAQLIRSQDYETAPFEELCHLSLDVGNGLGAVHSAGIVHGDLKLENILIFEEQSTSGRWTAKLCDFGSAVSTSPMSESRESASYLGSETWLPPECYEKLLLGKPLPRSLVPCDVFVYGLVVWAIFVGIHFSPLYKIQKVEGHGTDIVRHMGEQRFYARAKESVTACFSSSRSDIHQLLAAFTEQTFGHFAGGAERHAREYRQKVRSIGFHSISSDNLVGKMEDKITRILSVLRASLNDSHSRRDLQPWRYMDLRRSILPRVDNPAKYKPNYERLRLEVDTAREDERGNAKRQSRRWLEPTWATIAQAFGRIAPVHIKLNIRLLLQQRQHRDIVYQRSLQGAKLLVAGLQDLGPCGYLEHPPEGQHYVLDMLLTAFHPQPFSHSLSSADDQKAVVADDEYAWARLRSHFRLCCWREYCGRNPYTGTNAIEQICASSSEIDLRNLAWLCRGEIGRYELQQLNSNSVLLLKAWRRILQTALGDVERSMRFLLMFENGLDAHRILHFDGKPKTPFLLFLQSLSEPEKALDVAVHFRRIASEEATSPEKRYFLTGRMSDLSTEKEDEELLRAAATITTTALHDASKANNYALVEFLVANRFKVSALDSEGQLALDVATTGATGVGNRLAELNGIKALLNQNVRGGKRAKGTQSTSPLGWQETAHRLEEQQHLKAEGKQRAGQHGMLGRLRRASPLSLVAWQETSIEGDFDAITFIAPKTGLYESDRLSLGRIQGEGQVYRLDPVRFLKALNAGKRVRRRPENRAHFDEDWYREDIRAVEEPLPVDPLHDQRAWVRYPTQGLHYLSSPYPLWTLVFLLFALLSLFARFSWAPWLGIIFPCVGIGMFSAGLAPDNTIPLSTKDHFYNLWGNAPELFVSIFAVIRGEIWLMQSILIGFALTDTLWTPGLSISSGGLRVRDYHASWMAEYRNGIRAMTSLHFGFRAMTEVGLVASALMTMLVCFDLEVPNPDAAGPRADTVILSRGLAIILALLWIAFLFFRSRSHADLFNEDFEFGTTVLVDQRRRFPTKAPSMLALVRLILLGLCADTLIQGLLRQSHMVRTTCIYFAIPLTARLWAQIQGISIARDTMHGPYGSIESSFGSMLDIMLVVAPFLVILGWVIGSPVTLRFSLMEMALFDLAVWLVNHLPGDGMATWFSGAMLIILYIMALMGLWLGS